MVPKIPRIWAFLGSWGNREFPKFPKIPENPEKTRKKAFFGREWISGKSRFFFKKNQAYGEWTGAFGLEPFRF